MIVIRVYRVWKHVGSIPLFRTLVLDGATYYVIFMLAFALEIIANTSNVVSRLYFTVSNRPLLI
jgi:hypothetical protein